MESVVDSWLPVLLGAIVGAIVSLVSVFLASRLQRRASNEDKTDRAIEQLLLRFTEYISGLDAYQSDVRSVWPAALPPGSQPPHAAPLSIAIELLRMRTQGSDRAMADEIRDAWSVAARAPLADRAEACGHIAAAVTQWRLREPPGRIRASLETARQLGLEWEVSEDED